MAKRTSELNRFIEITEINDIMPGNLGGINTGGDTLRPAKHLHSDHKRRFPILDNSKMSEFELSSILLEANSQYATLYGHILTISFAVIVATHYFLCRTRYSLRTAVFLLYSIGMLTFVALFLQNANFKSRALAAMNTIPVAERSAYTQSIIDFSHHWLFAATGVFFNLSLWAIWLATAAMLFLWNPKKRSDDGAQAK